MSITRATITGNVPAVPHIPSGATEAVLNIQIPPTGNGQGGFITVLANVNAIGTVTAGPCTVTITQ